MEASGHIYTLVALPAVSTEHEAGWATGPMLMFLIINLLPLSGFEI